MSDALAADPPDRDTFSRCRGDRFRIQVEPHSLEAELIEVTKLGDADAAGRQGRPFSVLFRGPAEPILRQAIYHLEHPELGTLGLFLVPVGPDEHGMRYEAVFT